MDPDADVVTPQAEGASKAEDVSQPEGSQPEGSGPTPPPAAPPAEGKLGRARRFFRERYLTIDRRLLGLFRIYFGLLLLIDILRRLPDSTFFYSAEGSLSNHFALFAPMARPSFSLFF